MKLMFGQFMKKVRAVFEMFPMFTKEMKEELLQSILDDDDGNAEGQ
jgi:hypothetical protein